MSLCIRKGTFLFAVSSMFGSVVGSLATSMEIAQSFLNKEEAENKVEDSGVEKFAEVFLYIL